MKIGHYVAGMDHTPAYIFREMEDNGHQFRHDECICTYEQFLTELSDDIETIAICHPHDSEDCWGKIKKIVEAFPSTKFYILAFGKPDRFKAIGTHPNVTYLTDKNIVKIYDELLKI